MATDNTPKKVEVPGEAVPVVPVVDSGEGIAESYIAAELKKARAGLQRTMIGSIVIVLGVGIYLGVIANTFRQNLQPTAAAEIAAGVIDERIDTSANDLAGQLQERIPALIAGLPDYAKKELPNYRIALENQIEKDLTTHCQEASVQLGDHMDAFLEEHKDKIKDLLAAGQDKDAVKQLGTDLETEFMKWLQEKPAGGGESITQKIDLSLTALRDIEKKMSHLAANKNLTPTEKKTRRAIAIVGKTVEREIVPLKAGLSDMATTAATSLEKAAPSAPAEDPTT
jgi:hypothetical protein